MIGLLIAAVVVAALAVALIWRILRGPTSADRICALDALDLLLALSLALYSLYSGRAIYLDIALVVGLLGFVGTVLMSRYLEGRL